MVSLSRPYNFKHFKGYLPQILLGTFLNNLTYMSPFVILSKSVWLSVGVWDWVGESNAFQHVNMQLFNFEVEKLLVEIPVSLSSAMLNSFCLRVFSSVFI